MDQEHFDIIYESKTPWEDEEFCEDCEKHWKECVCKFSPCCGEKYDEDTARCPCCKENI